MRRHWTFLQQPPSFSFFSCTKNLHCTCFWGRTFELVYPKFIIVLGRYSSANDWDYLTCAHCLTCLRVRAAHLSSLAHNRRANLRCGRLVLFGCVRSAKAASAAPRTYPVREMMTPARACQWQISEWHMALTKRSSIYTLLWGDESLFSLLLFIKQTFIVRLFAFRGATHSFSCASRQIAKWIACVRTISEYAIKIYLLSSGKSFEKYFVRIYFSRSSPRDSSVFTTDR